MPLINKKKSVPWSPCWGFGVVVFFFFDVCCFVWLLLLLFCFVFAVLRGREGERGSHNTCVVCPHLNSFCETLPKCSNTNFP